MTMTDETTPGPARSGWLSHPDRAGWAVLLVGTVARTILATVLLLVVWSVVPACFGWSAHMVMSGSMAPHIRPGDVVLTSPVDPSSLRAGQIIAFTSPGNRQVNLIHRFQRINPGRKARHSGRRQSDGRPITGPSWGRHRAGPPAGAVGGASSGVGHRTSLGTARGAHRRPRRCRRALDSGSTHPCRRRCSAGTAPGPPLPDRPSGPPRGAGRADRDRIGGRDRRSHDNPVRGRIRRHDRQHQQLLGRGHDQPAHGLGGRHHVRERWRPVRRPHLDPVGDGRGDRVPTHPRRRRPGGDHSTHGQ
ncbi:MAG: hypothetical protein J0I11_11015 [Actinobacteria bacterium]|nr:hypothetical protein [Actinomycetota bacterium]